MKTSILLFVAIVACGATGLRAQSTEASPYAVPTTPPTFPGYGYGYSPMARGPYPEMTWAGSVTGTYATSWNAGGVSTEFGGLWLTGHFLGAEVSYYAADADRYDVYGFRDTYLGSFRSSRDVTTVDLAYRYFLPLGGRLGAPSPAVFYVGASAGAGFVHYSDTGAAYGFPSDNSADPAGEVVAGFQFAPAANLAFRIGYRYVVVNDAWFFNQRQNLESSVLEAGVAFRF